MDPMPLLPICKYSKNMVINTTTITKSCSRGQMVPDQAASYIGREIMKSKFLAPPPALSF